jgi:hypothetical protein
MGSILALLLIMLAVYIVVLIGTVAYQLTGLDWETAQFQALSAFTMTGFTTRASERVVSHPARRQITMALIVAGYTSTASVIATLVSSFAYNTLLEITVNLAILVAVVGGLVFAVRRTGVHSPLVDPVRRWVSRYIAHEEVPHEELFYYRRGFGITRVEVPRGSRVAGQLLRDADLKRHQLQVLAVETGGEIHPVPDADRRLEVGDHLVLYGRIDRVQEALGIEHKQALSG